MTGFLFRKEMKMLIGLVLLTAGIFFCSLFFGASDVNLQSPEGRWVLLELRLPRALLALMVGASLGLSGAVLQALFRNPLADPHLTGVSAGGAVGVVLGSRWLASAGALAALPVLSAAGSLAALALVYRLAKKNGVLSIYTLLLAGVMVNSFFIALIIFLQSMAKSDEMAGVLFWLLGSMGTAGRKDWIVAAAVLVPVFIFLLRKARALNLLSLGESQAQALGVPVERTKRTLFRLAALLTGSAVSASGMISFVGLIAPHLARLGGGADYRKLLPASALIGGSLLMLSDLLARTLLRPQELPAGVITSFLGVPFFLWLLKRRECSEGVS